MKSNIEKVYSKLPQKKHKFKNHKVALSLVDDIVNSYENIKSEADGLMMDVRKAAQDIDEVSGRAKEIINQIDATDSDVEKTLQSLDDLGIKLPSLPELSVAIRQLQAYRNELAETSSRAETASDGLFAMLG